MILALMRPLSLNLAVLLLLLCLSGCALGPHYDTSLGKVASSEHYHSGSMRPYVVRGQNYKPFIPNQGWEQKGLASWYGPQTPNHMTSDGEDFDMNAISAAHKTLPLPCIVEVTNMDNGKSLRLRVNDRGPFVTGRILDLSKGAAKALGVYGTGTAHIKLKFLGPAEPASGSGRYYVPPESLVATPAIANEAEPSGYIVQIGAFSDLDNAHYAIAKLNIAKLKEKNGLYIVYLGPFDDLNLAETKRQAAMDAGFSGAIIKKP